ncbi:MAG: 3-oxoacyl-ACP synthase [Bacteroidetes bacterium MedPE-SWsnd-G1]|nr:MAG: 3-oxoacyl-ACP synthase [Bacteroidetes bacterium MedPE-SWsnd-G1]
MEVKNLLFEACQEFVQSKLNTIEQTIQSNKNALHSETKSSAGDKHETGRAMLQLEMEKAGQQLVEVQKMQEQLSKIELDSDHNNVHLGSLVYTSSGTFFIAISKGQIKIGNEIYFAISSQSPIGKLLMGKSENEEIEFRGQRTKILNIV